MILMIDNYDSFTYNLVQYLGELKQQTVVYRNDRITLEQIDELAPAALVVSPGPCTPNEAGISVAAVQKFAGKIPILGVCLGHQAIAQAYGGTLQPITPMQGKVSDIYHNGEHLFKDLPNPMVATRYHSLVIDPSSMPKELQADSWVQNAQGNHTHIMGLHHRNLPVWGVQFHPESILTPVGKDLLRNFLTLAGLNSPSN
ncbi:MAG: anthranilate synthase component II [Gammaproteobacteria bacterium]